jgi:hypothetical protein
MKKYIFLIILIFVFIGASLTVVPNSWIPLEYRKYFLKPKFEAGLCIKSSKHWGVNPKLIIGFKITKLKNGYLLKDLDKYEHFQFISKLEVEKYAQVISCRSFHN